MKSIEYAMSLGFAEAVEFSADLLIPYERIRALCTPDKCPNYGVSWHCPPYCGTLEALGNNLRNYSRAWLLTSRYAMPCGVTPQETQRLSMVHTDRLMKFASDDPDALLLTVGGCHRCEKCTCPDAPCRFPLPHVGSVSAHGIDVTELCRKLNIPFAFEPGKVVFVGLMLEK